MSNNEEVQQMKENVVRDMPIEQPENDVQEFNTIEFDKLSERYTGRESFIRKIFTSMTKHHLDTPDKLLEIINNQDYESLSFLSHSLKGAAGNILATPVFELARDVDSLAKEKDSMAFSKAEQLIEIVKQMLDEMNAYLATEQTGT